jgi:hypothetical protein
LPRGELAQVARRVRVAGAGAQFEAAGLFAPLHGEGEQAAIVEHAAHAGKDRVEVADVDEDVGGPDQAVALRRALQMLDDGAAFERVVDAARGRRVDHRRREVDPVDRAGVPGQQRPQQPGAAAQVERGADPARAERIELRRQQLGRTVAQYVDEVGVEGGRIAAEQRLHVAAGRRRRHVRPAGHRGEQVAVQGLVVAVPQRLLERARRLVGAARILQQRATKAP